jgi:acyl dehydratase
VAVDDSVIEFANSHIGAETMQGLGEVSALMIRRYARAIGDDNPVYFDDEYARALGHPGIIAPPNLLTSIIDWGEGGREENLREDGTEGEVIVGIPQTGVRIMGGGEDMEFVCPATAGDQVQVRTRLDSVEERETKSGPMAVLRYRNTYETTDGRVLMTCVRSILLR